MTARPWLSLVFPVFNEQENIDLLLPNALALGKRLGRPFEIVVVDDGSRDRSRERIERCRAAAPEIRVVAHPSNRGYGAALRSGLREARGDWVFFSDADLQFDLDEIERLLASSQGFDIVAGYRAPRCDPWARRIIAAVWGLLIRRTFRLPVIDIDCAFKLFRRQVLDAVPIASVGAFVNTELLVRARSAGFRILQVPVSHRRRRRGRQTGGRPAVILRALLELALLHRELRRGGRAAGGVGPPIATLRPTDAAALLEPGA
jgi:glycosyltransferase involved in cell wall biosynthesis